MGRTLSLADHVDEIALAPPQARGGALIGGLRRIFGASSRPASGALRVTDSGISVRADQWPEDGVEIQWPNVRKLIVDDGTRWGYVSGVCRFPVYDLRQDGSGSGVLIGPLWSHAGSLLPEGCPAAQLEPVPAEAPNIALILDPALAMPNEDAAAIAILLLRAEDPEAARAVLADHRPVGDAAHDDLEYLTHTARHPHRASLGRRASAALA